MLKAHNVGYAINGTALIDRVSIALSPGELTVMIGPNGAGKSTLLKVLTGELKPSRGAVTIEGRNLAHFKPHELAQRRAVVPQATHLTFPFTVIEVVLLGAQVPGFSQPSNQSLVRARAALASVDLVDFENRLHTTLSGGEQQRVHLARAICQLESSRDTPAHSKLLLLDEPTSSLDLRHQLQVLDELKKRAQSGWTILTILHDLNLAALYADHLIVMDCGKVRDTGPVSDVFNSRTLSSVYSCQITTCDNPASGRPYVLPPAHS